MILGYIEPSAVSFVVQTIAGTAIALGAVAAIVISYLKKKTTKVLHMKEDSSKTIEDDIIITKDIEEKQDEQN